MHAPHGMRGEPGEPGGMHPETTGYHGESPEGMADTGHPQPAVNPWPTAVSTVESAYSV